MLFRNNQSTAYNNSFAQNTNKSKLIVLVVLVCFIFLMIILATLTSSKDISKSTNPASTNSELKKIDFRLGGTKASIYIPNGFEVSTAQPLKLTDKGSQSILIKKLDYSTEEKFSDLTKKLSLNIEGEPLPDISTKQEILYQKNVLLLTNKSTPQQLDYYIYQGSYLWSFSLVFNKDSKPKLQDLAPQIITSIEKQKDRSEDYLTE